MQRRWNNRLEYAQRLQSNLAEIRSLRRRCRKVGLAKHLEPLSSQERCATVPSRLRWLRLHHAETVIRSDIFGFLKLKYKNITCKPNPFQLFTTIL